MRNALIYVLLILSSVAYAQQSDSLAVADTLPVPRGKVVPVKGAFLQQLQERDSVLIADQLLYGFELKQVEEGTQFALPEWKNDQRGGVQAVSPWMVDTLKITRQKGGKPALLDIRSALCITSFDEGEYELPQIVVGRMSRDGVIDTLVFDPMRLEVRTMPVDTATFVPHDIKGQMTYPVTFKEVAPWIAGGLALAGVIALVIWLIVRYSRRNNPEYIHKDPPHIVALRKLDKYRGNAMWVPQKQKVFYSGVTDALREYISERYGIGAMEMTTAEIFEGMKATDAPKELLGELKELFERADYVKFAKFVASDEDNAATLPLAVRFVTATYQNEITNVEENPESSLKTRDDVQGGE